MSGERILVVDDELALVDEYIRVLAEAGYQVHGAGGGREALACLEKESFDLLLTDVMMPDVDGLMLLRRARELDPDMAAVVITAHGSLRNAIDALRAGARGFLLKPFDPDDLFPVVSEALEKRRQEQENMLLRARLPILEISQALMAEGNVASLAGQLLESVVRQIGAERASLMLLAEETEELFVAGAVGLPAEVVNTTRLPMRHGVIERVLLRKEPLLLEGETNWDPPLLALMGGTDVVAVCVPLRTSRRALGVLNLSRPAGSVPFTPGDLNLLSIMSNQVAVALDNACLHEEIRSARDYFRTVLDSLHDQVIVVDQDYILADANACFLQATGHKREEAIGQHCFWLSHRRDEPCDGLEYRCVAAEVWRTGRPARGLHIHYDQAGEGTYVDVAASPLRDERGQVTRVIEAFRDVTAEWRLQSRLAAIQALGQELVFARDEARIAQAVVNAAEEVLEFQLCDLWLVDKEKRVLDLRASTIVTPKMDFSPLPLDGECGITVVAAQSGEVIYLPDVQHDPRYVDGGLGTRSELCVPLKIGEQVIGVLNAESAKLDAFDEDDRQLFATLADQAALALENARLYGIVTQSKRTWEATFDAITDGISIHDQEFTIIQANRALARMLNIPIKELIGKKCYQAFHCEEMHPDRCPHRQAAEEGIAWTAEVDEPRFGGTFLVSTYPLLGVQGGVAGSVHIMKDITQRKREQEQLLRLEKLSALGRLAASLAHEINNPLQALSSGLRLLNRPSLDEKKRQQYLTVANREVDRLIGIVERMIGFYRPSMDTKSAADVHALLDEMLTLAGKKLQHSHVTVQREWASELPRIQAVANQLKQVFLNVILNAIYAMSEKDGGTLTISTACVENDAAISIRFADTGHGIAPEHLDHIFEPFYTTRPDGTGLGLSVSYSIVKQHGGNIDVESQPGQGTTFIVALPVGGEGKESTLCP